MEAFDPVILNKIFRLDTMEQISAFINDNNISIAIEGIRKTKQQIYKYYGIKTGYKCQYKNCNKSASFNYIGERRPIVCKTHILNGMVDVINKRCAYPLCKKSGRFGTPGMKIMYCKAHKKDDMIDIRNKKCEHEGCYTQPNFGWPGTKTVKYCKLHKINGMVQLRNKVCMSPGCKTMRYYGYPGSTAQFCFQHKLEGMEDVINKRCIKCNKQPTYGPYHSSPITCSKHKQEGYINRLKAFPMCHCGEPARYGIDIPIRCKIHSIENDTEIAPLVKCIYCYAKSPLPENDICEDCLSFLNDKEKRGRKESKILKLIENLCEDTSKDEIPVKMHSHDSIISECNKYRPDIVLDNGSHMLIIEIDEHQHRNYKCDCLRMQEIYNGFGGIPIIFIRFNPDEYKIIANGETETIRSYAGREKTLSDLILNLRGTIILEPLSVIYLYYDYYDGEPKREILQDKK